MRYEVIKPLTTNAGEHLPGDVIDADQFHNVAALVSQRYLRPVGDQERLDALEARINELEAQATGKGRSKH